MAKAAVTVLDVAAAAGVSKTTAVYVLNDAPHLKVPDATRQRVLAAARRLGYRRNGVAAALSRGRLHTVGVLIGQNFSQEATAVGTVYATAALSAVTAAAAAVGLRMTVMPVLPANPPTVEEVVDRRVDGLILISLQDDEFARAVYATGFPCVSIGSGYAERPVPVDDVGGAAAAAEHLIALGHRRLAAAIDPANHGRASRERLAGFLDACARHGLREGEHVRLAADEPALLSLLDLPAGRRPTALFAFNDLRAWTAVRQARARGIDVPGDLSVVGYDNNVLAEACHPPLTTVANPLRAQADAALEMLQALWRGETDPPTPPTIAMPLVVRESTAPPPPDPPASAEG